MRAMLHGVRYVDMVDEATKRPIRGFSCFVGYPVEGVEGQETTKFFVSQELASSCGWSPSVGRFVDIDFTPRGKVCGIATVHEK